MSTPNRRGHQQLLDGRPVRTVRAPSVEARVTALEAENAALREALADKGVITEEEIEVRRRE